MKKLIILLISIFSIFAMADFAEAAAVSCSVGTSCANTQVFKMSAATNAHAGTLASSYTTFVCCSGISGLGTTCGGATSAVVLRLSGTSNAHVEENTYSTPAYSTNVCLSSTNGMFCTYGTTCPTGTGPVVSISGDTNAHVGSGGVYSTYVCCGEVCDKDTVCDIAQGETYTNCPSDCCKSNCTGCSGAGAPASCTSDNACHAICNGYNSCGTVTSGCDGIAANTYACCNSNAGRALCCTGACTSCGTDFYQCCNSNCGSQLTDYYCSGSPGACYSSTGACNDCAGPYSCSSGSCPGTTCDKNCGATCTVATQATDCASGICQQSTCTCAPVGSNILTVTKTGSTGSGTASTTDGYINCGPACSSAQYNYASGTVVTLRATATATSTFTGWSGGGCSGIGSCIVTMRLAITVTATFNAITPCSAGGACTTLGQKCCAGGKLYECKNPVAFGPGGKEYVYKTTPTENYQNQPTSFSQIASLQVASIGDIFRDFWQKISKFFLRIIGLEVETPIIPNLERPEGFLSPDASAIPPLPKKPTTSQSSTSFQNPVPESKPAATSSDLTKPKVPPTTTSTPSSIKPAGGGASPPRK